MEVRAFGRVESEDSRKHRKSTTTPVRPGTVHNISQLIVVESLTSQILVNFWSCQVLRIDPEGITVSTATYNIVITHVQPVTPSTVVCYYNICMHTNHDHVFVVGR